MQEDIEIWIRDFIEKVSLKSEEKAKVLRIGTKLYLQISSIFIKEVKETAIS